MKVIEEMLDVLRKHYGQEENPQEEILINLMLTAANIECIIQFKDIKATFIVEEI